MKRRISIVVPFHNEEEVAPAFFAELEPVVAGLEYEVEILAVDDGSTDRTHVILSERARSTPGMRVLRFSRNFGHQLAMLAGIDHATGDAVVTIDGDLQDPPALIPDLLRQFEAGHDVVHTVRASRAGEPLWRKLAIGLYYRLLRRISRFAVPFDSGDFRLLSRRAAEQVRAVRDRAPYLRGTSAWIGFRQTQVTYDRHPRAKGRSSYGLWQLFRLAWSGITSVSETPLQVATATGLLLSGCGILLAAALAVGAGFFGRDPSPWSCVAALILFVGGVQLLILGILCGYVGRMFDEVRRRPLYILQEPVDPGGSSVGAPPAGESPRP